MRLTSVLLTGLLVVTPALVAAEKGEKKVPAVLNFKMETLDGKPVDLSKYQGKVVLFVNVASECGTDAAVQAAGGAPREVRQGRPGDHRRAGQRVRRPGAGKQCRHR